MATITDNLLHATSGDVHLWSLPNVKGELPERWVGTRSDRRFRAFLHSRDQPGRGVFYCVSTIKPGCARKKENVAEMPFLFADVDGKDLDIPLDEAERLLRNLHCVPSRIHGSGNGFHCLWIFDRPLTKEEGFQRAEALLKRLANMLGGDRQVCHRVALLRLPGSHNSKRGEWKIVRTIREGTERYTMDEIERWLDGLREPVIVKPNRGTYRNPFLETAERQGFKAPVDVFQRLADMRVNGGDVNGVHPTELSCTAAMMRAGVDIDDVVGIVLDAVRGLAGTDGWNWRVEERKIRTMCTDFAAKHPARKNVVELRR